MLVVEDPLYLGASLCDSSLPTCSWWVLGAHGYPSRTGVVPALLSIAQFSPRAQMADRTTGLHDQTLHIPPLPKNKIKQNKTFFSICLYLRNGTSIHSDAWPKPRHHL